MAEWFKALVSKKFDTIALAYLSNLHYLLYASVHIAFSNPSAPIGISANFTDKIFFAPNLHL
jgi:hypothetical protein